MAISGVQMFGLLLAIFIQASASTTTVTDTASTNVTETSTSTVNETASVETSTASVSETDTVSVNETSTASASGTDTVSVSETDTAVVSGTSTADADSTSTTDVMASSTVTTGGVQATAADTESVSTTATVSDTSMVTSTSDSTSTSVEDSTATPNTASTTSTNIENLSSTSTLTIAATTATMETSQTETINAGVQPSSTLSMTTTISGTASATTTATMTTSSTETPPLQISTPTTGGAATSTATTAGTTSTSSVIAPTSSSTIVEPTAIAPEDRQNGFAFTLQLDKCGPNITSINNAVGEALEKAFNTHCGLTNDNTAQCCSLTSSIPARDNVTRKFLSPGNVKVADNFPVDTCTSNKLVLEYVVVIVVKGNNSLCTWAKTPLRRRRAVAIPIGSSALDPSVAATILNQTQSTVAIDVGNAVNATVEIKNINAASIVYPEITTMEVTTTTQISTTPIPGLEAWMIALIVVGSVLALFIIFVIVYICCKKVCMRDSKVDDQEMRIHQRSSSPH